mgnify:CR=1 FL=1
MSGVFFKWANVQMCKLASRQTGKYANVHNLTGLGEALITCPVRVRSLNYQIIKTCPAQAGFSNLQILLLLFLLSAPLMAQQTPLSSLYRDQWSILNPGAISNNYLLNDRTMTLSASWREQWWNVPESPSTQSINWEWVQDDFNSVWGAHLLNDRTGKIGQTGLFARYAYRIRLSRRVDHSITVGFQGGIVQYRARLGEIQFPDPFTQPLSNEVVYRPDFGVGLFYHYKNRYYAGLSSPQTFGFESKFGEDPLLSIRRIQHVYAVLGGYWDATWIGNETSFIEPSVWFKYVPGAPLNIDLNFRGQFSELVWAGTGVNMGFGAELELALHLEAGLFFGEQSGLNFGQFKAGFGLDIPIRHALVSAFGAAAEVNLVYSWQ